MRRIKLSFIQNVEVEFVDRDTAIRQLEKFAEKGTRFPLVMYGPEGCGKTALMKQAFELLQEQGFSVVYVSPLEKGEERLITTEDLRGLIKEALKEASRLIAGPLAAILIEAAITITARALTRGKKKIAILADDVFQAIGTDKAEQLVKTMLNMIEYPPHRYDKIIVLVASSEGITRERVGRHRWSEIRVMWNMPREGLHKLYELLPGHKPPFEEVWKWTGGNPWILASLYETGWDTEKITKKLAAERRLTAFIESLNDTERETLKEALENPDIILKRIRDTQRLERGLIELNLITEVWDREEWLWIDEPPPERDPDLGIGRYYAWQTPLHREAVKKTLQQTP